MTTRPLKHYDFLASREAFAEFLAGWEAGTLPKARWTHTAHIAVGACYTVRYPDSAFERIKNGILRYNAAVGTKNSEMSGYHETLTRLWANVLAKVVHGFADPWEAACVAVAKLGGARDLPQLHYSFDVIGSREARRNWIPPDREGPY
jgi:hypothetical protein